MVYKYVCHEDIPNYMKYYLLTVSCATLIEAIPVEEINAFLNGLEEWETENYPELISEFNTVH
jgi:hypothetical protein